jgi:hypothetical protein
MPQLSGPCRDASDGLCGRSRRAGGPSAGPPDGPIPRTGLYVSYSPISEILSCDPELKRDVMPIGGTSQCLLTVFRGTDERGVPGPGPGAARHRARPGLAVPGLFER